MNADMKTTTDADRLSAVQQAARRYLRAEAGLREALRHVAHYTDPRTVGYNAASALNAVNAANDWNAEQIAAADELRRLS